MKREPLAERLDADLHRAEDDLKSDIARAEERHKEHDREIDKEKKRFEKEGPVKEAELLALADQDIVTDD